MLMSATKLRASAGREAHSTGRHALLLALLASCMAPLAAQPMKRPTLAECRVQFVQHPAEETSATCFYGQGSAALPVMEALRRQYPHEPWLEFYLAYALAHKDPSRAAALCREAAATFAAKGDSRGQFRAWAELDQLALDARRTAEAETALARAIAISNTSADPALVLRGKVLQAKHKYILSKLEESYHLLKAIKDDVFRDGSYDVAKQWLTFMGNSALELGHRDEAREAYLRLIDLAQRNADRNAEASARYNLANLAVDELDDPLSGVGRAEVIRLTQEALDAAIAAPNPTVEVQAYWLLGKLTEGQDAIQYLERCRDAAKTPVETCYCSYALAERLAGRDPPRARGLAAEGDRAAQQSDLRTRAFALWARVRVNWNSRAPQTLSGDSARALDDLDHLRDQTPPTAQFLMLRDSSGESYWLSGSLFTRSGNDPQSLASAFGITERRRWRTLLDVLEKAKAAPPATPEAQTLEEDKSEVLEQIAAVQLRLLAPELPPAARTRESHELEALEQEERNLRDRLAIQQPGFAALHPRHFATLSEVQQSLAPDQAMLSFQVAPWVDWTGQFGGGSWLLAVTRGDARVYRLPDRASLRVALTMFKGFFDRGGHSEERPGSEIYRQLLAPCLRDLGPEVRRLIILPDDVLYTLPFAALRTAPGAAPLGERYQLSEAPSATLWRRWLSQPRPSARVPALVLADPSLLGRSRTTSWLWSWFRRDGTTLPLGFAPLAYARKEGESIIDTLGGGILLTGRNASLAELRRLDPSRFGILHFAGHSILDESNPERSSVVLADVLLQPRQIVDLKLAGSVVVLASCSTALGSIVPGEGVIGLAHAFFRAGAHTVIGSLWPMQDVEAASLFERFYSHLANGDAVAGALAAAQRDRRLAGAPAKEWAGFVALGDGEVVPVRVRSKARFSLWGWAAGIVIALLVLLARRTSRARSRSVFQFPIR